MEPVEGRGCLTTDTCPSEHAINGFDGHSSVEVRVLIQKSALSLSKRTCQKVLLLNSNDGHISIGVGCRRAGFFNDGRMSVGHKNSLLVKLSEKLFVLVSFLLLENLCQIVS